jgi:Rrf2 family protein
MLSKKAQYALKALGYLTEKYTAGPNGTALERPVLIVEISVEKQIPIKFLESILLQLKNAGILGSRKGKGGGYFLKQHPSLITVARVLRIIDGPIAMLPCVSLYFYKKCEDCTEKSCRINKMFSEVRDATLHILEKRTLLDLATPIPPTAQRS